MEIWKFELTITDSKTIEMPKGAKFLTAQLQNGALCVWAMVNPKLDREPRRIQIIGTGNPCDDLRPGISEYLATVQQGRFVWHVFVDAVV